MSASTDTGPQDILSTKQNAKLRDKTLLKEFYSLSIKAIITIVGTWASLHMFELFVAPFVGIAHIHIQIAAVTATVIIAFAVITATRRVLKRFASRTHPQFASSMSFFVIIFISLIAALSVLYQLDVNPQEILVSGGVAAIILGIGVSTIVGNVLSSGLILTTYPAKIGDSIQVVNDNIRGRISEIDLFYTTVQTEEGKEYVVPNNAIIQGNIRILKDVTLSEQLPYSEGDRIEVASTLEKYIGTVIKITSKFTTVLDDSKTKEYILANSVILAGNFTIIKHRNPKD